MRQWKSKAELLAAGWMVLAAASLHGQAMAAQTTDDSKPTPAFEVASIKPDNSQFNSSSRCSNGRSTATNIQLKTLIQSDAFETSEARVLGQPSWLSSDRFDIDAKVDDAVAEQMGKPSREDRTLWRQQLFQRLLADRFNLAFHREPKGLPVYALVVAKNGSKIERSKNTAGNTGASSGNGSLTAKGLT